MAETTSMHEAYPNQAALARDAEAVLEMACGAWIPQVARVAALLHVPDHLADGVETAEEIARIERSDPRSTTG